MKQTTFWQAKAGGGRLPTGQGACTLLASRSASIACPALWPVTHGQRQKSGPRARCSPARHHRKRGLARLSASLATDYALRIGARFPDCRSASFPPLPAQPRRNVTMALQACNAKKNFSRTRPVEPVAIRASGCNACQHAPIFWKNASVSYAVEDSIDCMMLNRNSLPDFPCRPGLAGFFTHVKTRSHSTCRISAAERGAS